MRSLMLYTYAYTYGLVAASIGWHTCTSAFIITSPLLSRKSCSESTALRGESDFPWEKPLDKASEETLLKIHLSILKGVDPEIALTKVQNYLQAFPFSAVLPVQPLQYLPTHDGVDVLFLRKKTAEKGSEDGGMRFYASSSPEGGIDLEIKRNSKGQTVSKMFSEKLVVQAFCDGIAGKQDAKTGDAPVDFVSISSMFHQWM